MASKRKSLMPKGAIKTDKKIIRDEQIKQNIVILDELRDLIPQLKGEEHKQLEDNIIAEGCRERLILWERSSEEYILVDGHNRYGICQKHGVSFNIQLKEFGSMEAVKDFMIDNQLGRRNLTPEMASYLRGLKYERYKAKEKNVNNLKQFASEKDILTLSEESGGQQERAITERDNLTPSGNTAQKLAQEFKVSEKTIKRDADFAKGLEVIGKANPTLKKEIISGTAKPKKADIQLIGKKAPEEGQEIRSIDDIHQLAERLKAAAKKTVANQPKANGASTSNPFAAKRLRAADVLHYTLMVAEKYPGELKNSGDQKRDLQQLQKLAVKALNEAGKQQEGSWLEKALEKEIKALA
jgi:hypothetical protein